MTNTPRRAIPEPRSRVALAETRSAASAAAVACAILAAACGQLTAAPPDLEAVFPPGARRGSRLQLTLRGKHANWPTRAFAATADGELAGVRLTPRPGEKGVFDADVAPEEAPGVCWIRLLGDDGISLAQPFVIGALDELLEDEAATSAAGQLVAPARRVVNGRLAKSGEVDIYRVDLARGEALVADVLAHRVLASPMDASLQVVSADGFVLAENDDDQGLDPRIVFTAPADGRYAVRVFAFPETPNSTIGFSGSAKHVYRLTLTTGAFVDRTMPLCVTAGDDGPVELLGWNLGASGRRVALGGSSRDGSRSLALGEDAAGVSAVPVVARPSVVEPRSASGGEATAGSREPLSIALPLSVSGRIEAPGEDDEYLIDLASAQQVRFSVVGRALGSPIDPVITVLAPDGKELARADDVGSELDCATVFRAPSAGEYRVVVRDLYAHGSPRHVYRLDALDAAPDFALEIATSEIVLAPRTPASLEVTVRSLEGFTGEVVVDALDRPPGVAASPVRVTLDGKKPATAKLELRAEFGPLVATMRVVGRSASAGDTGVRTARIASAGSTVDATRIFVAVAAGPRGPAATAASGTAASGTGASGTGASGAAK